MAKTIVITGASTGIGRACAIFFAQKGWNVVATMRSPEKATVWAKESNITCMRLDVTDTSSIQQAISETLKKFSQIDVVVNNAGYGLLGPFEASTEEHVARQFNTNVFGLMNFIREVLPHLRERRSGTIINVASMGGRVTFPLFSVYHATKWAIEGFSESLQHEVRPFNIRVKIIEPGPIKTDFYERSMDVMTKPGLTAYDQFVGKAVPNMNKAGETAPGPELVAKVIYRAATDNSWKIRYAANSKVILSLRRLLPDMVFNSIVRMAVLR